MSECIFCKIVDKSISSQIVYESADVLAFYDLNPQAPTHILIIPKKHVPKLSSASAEDVELLGKVQIAARDIAAKLKIDDFRLVLNNGRKAGQSVDHIHYHLLGGRRMNWPPG